jgi:hypothetical protein
LDRTGVLEIIVRARCERQSFGAKNDEDEVWFEGVDSQVLRDSEKSEGLRARFGEGIGLRIGLAIAGERNLRE